MRKLEGMMIHLFTDFGVTGPYMGQMRAVLADLAPGEPVIDLMVDAPAFRPRPSAHLLAALAGFAPPGGVFVCVVDPGVGTERRPIAMRADGRIFVGPDNGLLSIVARRAEVVDFVEIIWRPERLSASFHGRDLFAPIGALLAVGGWEAARGGEFVPLAAADLVGIDWSDDPAEVVYVDAYGNAMTGLRASAVAPEAGLIVKGDRVARRRTFGEVPMGDALVYENSCGLLEIAVNGGDAAARFGLAIGDGVEIG